MSLKGTKSTVSCFIPRAFFFHDGFSPTAQKSPFIQKEENLAVSRQKEEDKSLRYGDSVFETLHSIEITDIRARVLRGKKVELVKRPLCRAVSASIISVPSLYKKFYDTTHFILSGVVEARAQLLEEKERSIFMQFLLVSLKLFLDASERLIGGTSSSPPLLVLIESLIRRRWPPGNSMQGVASRSGSPHE